MGLLGVRARRLTRWANLLNGSTALGLLVARAGRATVRRGEDGLLLATGYRFGFPRAGAFTVGDVVLTRHGPGWLEARPALLRHERRHTVQYAVCLGLPLLPLYAVAAGWSWLRGGDPAGHNPFERLAGLEDGGYRPVSRRRRRPRTA